MPSMRNHRPGSLAGWRRVFSLVGINNMRRGTVSPDALDCAVLAIRPDETAPPLLGCLFEIPRAELDAYLEREARYKPLQVVCTSIDATRRTAVFGYVRTAVRTDTLSRANGNADFTWSISCSQGSNGIQQLRERCQNPALVAFAALLPDHVLCFAGRSTKREGAVASVIPCEGSTAYGSVVYMTDDELRLLDGFEGTNRDDPYAQTGIYRRHDVTFYLKDGRAGSGIMYLKNDLTWRCPPSWHYLEACLVHIYSVWGEQAHLHQGRTIEVRDGRGEWHFTYPPHPSGQGGANAPAVPAPAAARPAAATRGGGVVEALTVVEQTDDEFRALLAARRGDYEAEVGRYYRGPLWG
eukprot:3167171-Prymnesium_polylepis.1